MRVIRIARFGGPDVLQPTEAPLPEPGPGQIRLRVAASGINFAETLMREDLYPASPVLPTVLGSEVAGVVEALGEGVTGPVPGTRVAAPLFAAGIYDGGYAEAVVIDARYAVPLPETLGFAEATALMVQGLSALHLTRVAAPKGRTVLINAAAGGVGSLLVQLARRAGATRIIAAASTAEKRDFALGLGADVAVDYTAPGWKDAVRAATGGAGPDILYDSVGGTITMESLAVLAPRGQMVIFGALNARDFQFGAPELGRLIFSNQSVTGFALVPLLTQQNVREDLAALFDLAARGQVSVTIGGRFPLEDAAGAHRALGERRSTGKLVLVP